MTGEVIRLTWRSEECCERLKSTVAMLEHNDHARTATAALGTYAEMDLLESDASLVMRSAMSHLFCEEPRCARSSSRRRFTTCQKPSLTSAKK